MEEQIWYYKNINWRSNYKWWNIKVKKRIEWYKNRKWNIKKSSCHIHEKIENRINFIESNKDKYDVKKLCKILKVTRSDYYYHINHKTNIYKESNEKLDIEIKRIYNDSKGRYGSPKITKILKNEGIEVSQKRVARRIQLLGFRSITIKKYNHSGNSKTDDTKEYPNLLEQDFFAEKPSQKWVGDITYIYTKETGCTYLAIVMDLFDLKIVGWSYGLNMTDDLVIDAFKKALINRGLNEDGIFHSDRGSQYTSNDYEELLNTLKIKHSYSKKGYPYDNASMESFNAILKKEEVNVNNYETFEEAKLAIFEFIESWYNNIRIHSTLGYITPNEKYNNYIADLALA